LADDLPTGIPDTTVAYPGRSSLSLFVPQRKSDSEVPNMTKHIRHSLLYYLFRFLKWREGFLIPIICSYDDLPSLIRKTLLHYWISIFDGNIHQLRRSTKSLWQIAKGGAYRPALKPAQSVLCRHGGEGGYEQPSKQSFVAYLTGKKLQRKDCGRTDSHTSISNSHPNMSYKA
jgi:hypothetical protein